MAVEMKTFKSRKEWLAARGNTIGGSDAGSVLGLSKWRTNTQLWKILCGYEKPEDISDRPFVKYGTDAEPILRKLFALHHPELEVKYIANNMVVNSNYPFAHASLDGWIKDENGRMGVLEIKTTEITSKLKAQEWVDDHIPDQYFAQVCHCMLVCEYDFAILCAELKVHRADGSVEHRIVERHIERSEVIADIKLLEREERKFFKHVQNKTSPPTILPSI
jgi:putative phage-type endonuclease